MYTFSENEKREITMLRVTKINRNKLRKLKHTLNLPTYDSVISHIIAKELEEHPVVSYEAVMADTIPIILTGLPGSGKTHFLKNIFIPKLPHNIALLLIDIHNEYDNPALQHINLGDFFSINFNNDISCYRLIPSSNVDVSRSEIDSVFRHLIMFQKELKNWIIMLEEAHRFQESPFVKSFMAESRKNTRKVIVVSQQVEHFKGLGRIVKSLSYLDKNP